MVKRKRLPKTRKTIRIISTVITLLAIPYIFFYIYVNEYGKELIVEHVKKKYNITVKLENFTLTFPFKVLLVDFRIQGFKCEQAYLEVKKFNPFTKKTVIDKLYLKGLDMVLGNNNGLAVSSSQANQVLPKQEIPKKDLPNLKINRVIIDHSNIIFKNNSLNPPLDIRLANVDAILKDVSYAPLGKFFIKLKSDFIVNNKKMDNVFAISGWIDWEKKDLDIKFAAKKIDYFAFGPYYPPFWKPANLELKQGYFSLAADLVSKNNVLDADYCISVSDVLFNEEEEPQKVKNFKTVLALINNKVCLKEKTQLTKPVFRFDSIGEGIVEQLKLIQASKDSFDDFFKKTQDAVDAGVTNVKGVTVDPILGGVKNFFQELIKNTKRILGVREYKE